MQTESTQIAGAISLPIVLLAGWVIAELILAYGWFRRSLSLRSLGIVANGLMILLTPLTWYAYAVTQVGATPLGIVDVLILAVTAFLAGGVVLLGILWPRVARSDAGNH